MLFWFMGTGLYFSAKSRFLQLRRPFFIFRSTFGKMLHKREKSGISPLAALSTALAACMGTGNIIGVAGALCLGGPGSVFWMIVSALLGEMTAYTENVLGILHREKNSKGEWQGGSMLYIERAFESKKTAVVFSIFCVFSSLGMGNMTQANAMAGSISEQIRIYLPALGVAIAAICGMVIFGGVRRITQVTEKIIPLLSFITIAVLLAVIIKNHKEILPSIKLILSQAFNIKSVFAGTGGYTAAKAIKYGIARGVFSNEAGLGSSPIVHSAADVRSPEIQGLWGIVEVFIDTVLMCSLTALAMLTSGAWQPDTSLSPTKISSLAFESVLGNKAGIFLSIALGMFAFATIIGWGYYGEKAAEYAFGEKSITLYRLVYLACIVIGTCAQLETVWALSDIFNALMAVPNLAALWKLRKQVEFNFNK